MANKTQVKIWIKKTYIIINYKKHAITAAFNEKDALMF